MEKLLSVFIHESTDLLSEFTDSITLDNQKMVQLRKEKTAYFEDLQNSQSTLASIISNFEVFPEGFETKCKMVDQDLSGLSELQEKLSECRDSLSAKKDELSVKRAKLLEQKNLTSWDIKNSKFSEIINHFTITAHKEAAGKIGGFEIEHGAEQGEITFF